MLVTLQKREKSAIMNLADCLCTRSSLSLSLIGSSRIFGDWFLIKSISEDLKKKVTAY